MHHSGEAKNREGRTTRGGFELGGLSRKQLRVVRFVERKHQIQCLFRLVIVLSQYGILETTKKIEEQDFLSDHDSGDVQE